jgi:uncharacterized protein DUF3857
MRYLIGLSFLFLTFICHSQSQYSIDNIPLTLKENANSVVQNETVSIEIFNIKKLKITSEIVISILNKKGNGHLKPYVNFNESTKIRNVEAIVYDKSGQEVEKYRRKDFIDLSAVEGGTLYSDDRVLVFNYTPSSYPYTVVFRHTIETSNTAYIQPFYPLGDYNSSVMESNYVINYHPDVQLNFKKLDPGGVIIMKEEGNRISLTAKDLKAIDPEHHSPRFDEFAPHVLFSLDSFYLEGVHGIGSDWSQFGKWIYFSLLKDVSTLPISTRNKVKNLVAGDLTIEEKARRIYEYMQENTRYISVQIGIGGWKPIPAMEVDNLGYGDCKALTNYTKALLDVAEIPSYYTVVYAGSDKRDMLPEFASLRGNHVILAVPNEEETIWLECTNQNIPFGFLGSFTDDRDVLMVTPEGGKIVHTESYGFEDNSLRTTGVCQLYESGDIDVQVDMESSGIQYGQRYEIITKRKDDKEKFYKNYWDYIDNISIYSIEYDNNKEEVKLKESIEFEARAYTSYAGENIIFNVNILNRASYIPKRYKNRQRPLNISRGYLDIDEVTIELPEGFQVNALPEPIKIESKFGLYTSEISRQEGGNLVYRRKFELYKGVFPKEEYKNYRKFRKEVAKNDNQKLILIKQ